MAEANKSARTYLMFAIVVTVLFIVNAVISYNNRKKMQQQLVEVTRQKDSLLKVAKIDSVEREIAKVKLEISSRIASMGNVPGQWQSDSLRVGKDLYYVRKGNK